MNFRTGASPQAERIEAMCDLLAHRGPDASGVWCDGPVALGHRRLAIIDLSEAGRQPMFDTEDRLAISFNGELYNYLDLRAELETLGHRFRTRTDTEVLMVAYRQWGDEFLTWLNGMFAFALWDRARRRVLLARDRVGKKPLYFREDADGLAFASEPKAFLADPSFTAAVNLPAIHQYLTYQYVPAPNSAFQGVQRVMPAECLIVENGTARRHTYWRLKYASKLKISEEDAAAELRTRIRNAVRRRLMSDVPLGAFLSGGIDSGTVVAMMAELASGAVRTFSIGFEEQAYNELEFAKQVATRYNTEHTEFVVRPDAVDILPRLVWHYNEPYADSSAVPTWYLAELTRRYVTVALNGDGGDESFAGYDRYYAAKLAEPYDGVPSALRRLVSGAVRMLPAPHMSKSTWARAYRFGEAFHLSSRERYARWMMHLTDDDKAWLCTPEFLRTATEPDAALVLRGYAESDAADLLDQTMAVDVGTYLPDDLLVKVDIASMAHSLEARSPLLDVEVMEFAAALPPSYKMRGSTKKYILKRAIGDLLPPDLLTRPKMGFGVPLDDWFRGPLRQMTEDLLMSRRAVERGYFRQDGVRRLIDEHVRGVRNWHYQLWNLLMLEVWHQTFIDVRPTAAPSRRVSEVLHA